MTEAFLTIIIALLVVVVYAIYLVSQHIKTFMDKFDATRAESIGINKDISYLAETFRKIYSPSETDMKLQRMNDKRAQEFVEEQRRIGALQEKISKEQANFDDRYPPDLM
jgi:peptidoglycan hydrolase CwlO-like protein